MAGDPAELAYGHALAMLGDPGAAADVAKRALRRAGRARSLVLGHARAEAVAKAAQDDPVDIENLQTVVLDLPALAATLASTRPPEERAALDVRARTSGDLVALGDSLGMRPTDAADRCAAIAEEWERTLDPALLAFSGPGECEALGALLTEAPLETVADLLAVAPAVQAHAADCTLCTDRVRAMALVRSFFSDAAVDVPASVREAGRRDRTKRPSSPPPPLFASPTARRKSRVWLPLAAAAVVAIVAIPVAADRAFDGDDDAAPALTRVATARGVRLATNVVDGHATGLHLSNDRTTAITYKLSSSAQWLRFSRPSGRVAPGTTVSIPVELTEDTPEGDAVATVIAHLGGGETMSQEFTWHTERPPQLATVTSGCAVSVTVVHDGDLATFQLHWRDTVDHLVDIVGTSDSYTAELRPETSPITYWATATDTRGNAARTADGVIEPGAC